MYRSNMRKLAFWLTPLLIVALAFGAIGCNGEGEATPTPTPTQTPVYPVATPTPSPSPTPTGNTTVTPTPIVSPIPAPQLRVHFIDVGQGDAILLDLEETEVLIDGGGRSSDVVEYLRDYIDGSLEAVIATHPHADHIGGLIDVLGSFDVDGIWHNGEEYDSATYREFMTAVGSEGAEVDVARRGDFIEVDGLRLRVLRPHELGDHTNNNSIVLELNYGDTEFLFMGDAEHEAEFEVLMQWAIRSTVSFPGVDFLKVAYHGSRTSSSQSFLDMIRPQVAIYMAGEGNRYGHPHEETLSRLKDIGALILGTNTDGTIVVTTDGDKYISIGASARITFPTFTPAGKTPSMPPPLATQAPAATPTPTPIPSWRQ